MRRAQIEPIEIYKDPWGEVIIPEPPNDAPREQLFEFAALGGAVGSHSGWISDFLKRIITAYVERWHDDIELPPIVVP